MSDHEDSNIRKQLVAAFGHDDIYQILGVARTATTSEIKKGYMKLALIHHPDKGGDKEKFQALSVAHSIVSDEEKRKLYDSNGSFDDSDGTFNEENFDFWYQYFRNLFPKIGMDDINRFEEEYIGSDEEKRDVLQAYQQQKGHLMKIMDTVMFAEAGHETRIIAIIDAAIEQHALDMTKAYQKTRAQAMSNIQKPQKAKKSKQTSSSSSSDEDALAALIQARHQNQHRQQSALASILQKYETQEAEKKQHKKTSKKQKSSEEDENNHGKRSAELLDADEEEFQRIQQSLKKRKT